MQMYRGLPILTNQPSAAELEAVPHHLVGVWELEHRGSVAEFGELARAAIGDIAARGRTPVLCGGSGLYLRAALAPIGLPPEPEEGVRETGSTRSTTSWAQSQRMSCSPSVTRPRQSASIPTTAAAWCAPWSWPSRAAAWRPMRTSSGSARDRGGVRIFGLVVDPAELDRRIAARTEAMFEAGVEDEVRTALAEHRFSETAARMHGLQDVQALLRGEIDRDESMRRMTLRTRQYAKRQRTWMRRLPGIAEVARGGGDPGAGSMSRRPHDAVREARDAMVLLVTATPVLVAAGVLVGVRNGDIAAWLRFLGGAAVVGVLLLMAVACGLLIADRVGGRYLQLRPRAMHRMPLIAASLLLGLLLIVALPQSWPVLIGLAVIAVILGAIVLTGAALNF